MKKIPLFIFALLWLGMGKAQTNVSGGIYSNTTWTLAGSPYIVTDTVVVFPGYTLTIQPGVVVKFDSNMDLEIRQATLIALGTPTDSITFTSNSSSPTPGCWSQVYFTVASLSNSRFNYCNFKYATYGIWNDAASDTLFIKNSTFSYNFYGLLAYSTTCIIIDTSDFYYNTYGVYDLGNGSIINMCKFSNNFTGMYIPGANYDLIFIKNCIAEYNNIGWDYLGYTVVDNCIVKYNNWGIYEGTYSGWNTIQNTVIDSNKMTGYTCMNSDTLRYCKVLYNSIGIYDSLYRNLGPNVIYDNVIDNNGYGLLIIDSNEQIACNSICNNTLYNLYYEALLSDKSKLKNNTNINFR